MSIGAVQATLQPVEHHQSRFVLRPGGVFAPRQIDKITVRELKSLPVRRESQLTANQARQHGLQMTIAHAAHRVKLTRVVFGGRHFCGGDFNHSTRAVNHLIKQYTAHEVRRLSNMWSCGLCYRLHEIEAG